MVQAPSANTDSQARSSSSTSASSSSTAAAASAPAPAAAPAAAGGGGESSSGGSSTASKEVAAAGGVPSSSVSSAPSLGPPRYMRPPRGENDYASACPDEVLLRVLSFCDLDTSVHASLTAPRWQPLFNEKVAQAHCERIYLDQAHSKVLNPARFQSSYKRMISLRPRVRMNGFYFLFTSYIKKPIKDMWTEIKPGTILEVKYYRYLRFLPNGRLVYALLYQPPHEAVRIFRENRHKDLCEGEYHVHKGEVVAEVRTHYAVIHFRFQIQDGSPARGKFTQLYLVEHSSLAFNDPTGQPIAHKLPHDNFNFHRVGREL